MSNYALLLFLATTNALTLWMLLELLGRVKYTSQYWLLLFEVSWEGGEATTVFVAKNKGYPDPVAARATFTDKLELIYGMDFTARIISCDGITNKDAKRLAASSFFIEQIAEQVDFSTLIPRGK